MKQYKYCKDCNNVGWCDSEFRTPDGYCDDYKLNISIELLEKENEELKETETLLLAQINALKMIIKEKRDYKQKAQTWDELVEERMQSIKKEIENE